MELRGQQMIHPLLYELNARSWLRGLSGKEGVRITFANVPESEFARWRHLGFTHLWLMGVWQTGPRTRGFSLQLSELRETAARLLPDFSEEDIVGSPYAIAGYRVSESLGGETELREFRRRLAAHGIRLILDFIPNHTGLDHPWLNTSPELFVGSSGPRPGTFRRETASAPGWIAHGKDPYFPPWADTAQLDYRNPATHAAMIGELKQVARLCDGVRCDMAMLVLKDVFRNTWAEFPPAAVSSREPAEFWGEAIPAVKSAQPDFLFLAEAYWDLEPRLLDLGFDFAYDKRLTDCLLARRPADVQRHLMPLPTGPSGEVERPANSHHPLAVHHGAHFLENHDEPRVASLLTLEEHRAAALLVLTLPGMRLLHQGQLVGAALRPSVHLARCPSEPPQPEIAAFYELFLTTLQKTAVGRGRGELLEPTPAWEGNPTARNFILIQWQTERHQFELTAINLARHRSQCFAKLNIDGLADHDWTMTDLVGQERFRRDGGDLSQNGLYLDLPAHGAQLFRFSAV